MRELLFWGAIFGSFPAIWRNPYWGIILYGALNIVRPELLFWGGRSYNKAGLYVFAVTFLATLLKAKVNLNSAKTQLFLLLWLGVALKVSIYFSQYQIERAHYYANEIWKILFFCILLTVLINNEKKIKILENVFLGCMTFLGVWAIEQHFGGNDRLESFGNMDSNGLAAFFVLFTPLAFNKLFDKQAKYHKSWGALSTIVVILTIIFTQSRGGFLGLAAASLMWFRDVKQKGRVIFLGIFILVVIGPFIGSEYVERLQTMNPEEGESLDGSAYSRIILWEAGLMIFSDNPILGTGFMTYPEAKMKYKSKFDYIGSFQDVVFREDKSKVSHNTYVQLLSDGGLFLAAPYFLMILLNYINNYKIKKRSDVLEKKRVDIALLKSIEAGITGYCVCIMFIDSITFIFLPVQIVISAIIRSNINKELT